MIRAALVAASLLLCAARGDVIEAPIFTEDVVLLTPADDGDWDHRVVAVRAHSDAHVFVCFARHASRHVVCFYRLDDHSIVERDETLPDEETT